MSPFLSFAIPEIDLGKGLGLDIIFFRKLNLKCLGSYLSNPLS